MDDILIIVILILLNGVFSMSEMALVSVRKSRLATDARQGSPGAKAALKLTDDPDRFLSTVQIGITLIGILTGLYSGNALADDVGDLLARAGLQARMAHTLGQILIVAAVTFLSIVVGELVPKRIGLAAADTVSKLISRPMRLLSVVSMPVVWLLSASTALIVKALGLDTQANRVTEEEIRSLIRQGADSGEVKAVEQDIMERVLVMGDLRVSAIMTPKTDIATMRLGMNADEVKNLLSDDMHNYYPVYCTEHKSKVCGVVSLKQLVLKVNSSDFALADIVTQPEYFPESMSIYDALDRMKGRNVHFAIVCDEFGEMTGVITPADILDALVGEISASAAETGVAPAGSDGVWSVDAGIPVYDFFTAFKIEDRYKPASYSTLGGLILEELRHIPVKGEKLAWNGIEFEIASVDGAKIRNVLVRLSENADRQL